MAKFDPEKVTKLMEERAKELAEMTGLDFDVAKAFCSNLKPRGSAGLAEVRGYKKGEWPKKKTPS